MQLTYNYIKSVLTYISPLFFTLLLWEHIAKKKGSSKKPSTFFQFLATYVKNFWYTLGLWFAKLSSFYTYLNLNELYESALDLLSPIFSLIWSPLQFVRGYFNTALKYKYALLVFFGSVTLVGMMTYGIYWLKFGGPSPLEYYNVSWLKELKNLKDLKDLRDTLKY